VADEPEPMAEEPEPVADETEPMADEPEPETATVESAGLTEAQEAESDPYRVTFVLPAGTSSGEDPIADDEGESVGGLIVSAEAKQYSVQVGAFLREENAVRFAQKLRGLDYPAYVFRYTDTEGNAWNAVRTGDFEDVESAKAAAAAFEARESISAIVTKIDSIKMILK
jgi:cell division septation protein DedD